MLYFVSNGYRPHLAETDQLLERAMWSLLDGFLALPQTIAWVLSGLRYVASLILPLLRDSLGVDLSEASTAPDIAWQGGPSLGIGDIHFAHVLAVALWVVTIAAIAQFLTLFVLLMRNRSVVWLAPATPRLNGGRQRLLFGIVPLAAGMLALAWGIQQSMVGAVLGGALVGIIVRYPFVGALPIWLGFLVGLHPHQLSGALARFVATLRRRVAEGGERERRGEQRQRWHHGDETGADSSQSEREWRSSSTDTFEAGEITYREALNVLGLEDGEFDRAMLRRRFTELANRVHADQGGSSGLMRNLNVSYDIALSTNGWRR